MVRRWIRSSRYSGVISAADSRRTPRSIFAIMSLAWSLISPSLCRRASTGGAPARDGQPRAPLRLRIPLPALDHTHGLAFGSWDRSRRHDRELDAEAGRLAELL